MKSIFQMFREAVEYKNEGDNRMYKYKKSQLEELARLERQGKPRTDLLGEGKKK